MRIHSDTLTETDFYDAGKIARVLWNGSTISKHGSRTRANGWEVILRGESNRSPMGGGDGKAATWDQWGVFLGVLFDRDPSMTCRAYEDFVAFDYVTKCRFVDRGEFPSDYHGDHVFRWNGIPRQQDCTKCSASYQWKN